MPALPIRQRRSPFHACLAICSCVILYILRTLPSPSAHPFTHIPHEHLPLRIMRPTARICPSPFCTRAEE